MKVYLYETFHRCESITDWTPTSCSLALDSTQKVEGKYSIKLTSDNSVISLMEYSRTVDWSEFEAIVFSVYHPGWTNEYGSIALANDVSNWKVWDFDFAASWKEITIAFTDTPASSLGTLDLSNITYVQVYERNVENPGEDYYFDFFHGRSIDISSDVINPLSFIEHAVRDCPKLEFMAKGTWIPSRDYTIEILDYYTSNGSTTADQIVFEGSVIDYELTLPRKIWCVSRAKSDLDEFRPNGDYNGDVDSNHIKTLIAECSYITEGTIDATTGNTDNTFKGDKTFRTILNDWADKHLKHWYLSPTGALSFNDADVDSGAVLHYHKGTYNFKDEAVGTSGTDIDFVDAATLYNGGCSIIAEWQGHKKVLKLVDDITAGEDPNIYHYFTQAKAGTHEVWFGTDDVTQEWNLILFDSAVGDQYVRIRITTSKFQYTDNVGAWQDAGVAAVNNTIYHLRVVWRVDDTWDLYINETITNCDNQAFQGAQVSGLLRLRVKAFGDSAQACYLDAYGKIEDPNYNVGDNLKGDPFQCWNVKPKKHVDAINWVVLLGAIVEGVQISQESKDQNSIDELGPKIYKDTYAFIKVEAQLLIAANNLRTREQLLPLAINLWSYEANRGLIQAGEIVWFAQDRATPSVSPRQVIVNKIIYRFLSGHANLQTTDGIAV